MSSSGKNYLAIKTLGWFPPLISPRAAGKLWSPALENKASVEGSGRVRCRTGRGGRRWSPGLASARSVLRGGQWSRSASREMSRGCPWPWRQPRSFESTSEPPSWTSSREGHGPGLSSSGLSSRGRGQTAAKCDGRKFQPASKSPSQGLTQPGVAAGRQARPGARPPPPVTWPRPAVLSPLPSPVPLSALQGGGGSARPGPAPALLRGGAPTAGRETSLPAPPSVHGRPAPLEAAFRAGRLGKRDGGARGETAAGGPKSMEPGQGPRQPALHSWFSSWPSTLSFLSPRVSPPLGYEARGPLGLHY